MHDYTYTLTDLNPDEYNLGWHFYPFMVILDRCSGNCNILGDSSTRTNVPNKAEDVSLSVFNMITKINESKALTKDVSYEFKCKFDGKKYNLI